MLEEGERLRGDAEVGPFAVFDAGGRVLSGASLDTAPLVTRLLLPGLAEWRVAVYQRVAEISIATATYKDTIDGSKLGRTLTTLIYEPPPPDLQGISELANGVYVAFRANEVLFSQPYQPWAWPTDYRYTVANKVVALGVDGVNVVAVTEGRPGVFSGVHPAAVSQSEMPEEQP